VCCILVDYFIHFGFSNELMAETITKSLLLEPYSIYNIYTTKVLFKFEKVRGILQQMPTRWLV